MSDINTNAEEWHKLGFKSTWITQGLESLSNCYSLVRKAGEKLNKAWLDLYAEDRNIGPDHSKLQLKIGNAATLRKNYVEVFFNDDIYSLLKSKDMLD